MTLKTTTYYLPIESVNLAHYFVKGCVCPTKYIERRNKDIQNKFDNQLLFSNKQFTKDTNCSLEIVLNNDEKEEVKKITDHFFLFNTPLPISRIKKITFLEEEQRKKTVNSITIGSAFLLDELTETNSNSGNHIIESTELKNPKDNIKSDTDWRSKIDKYNSIMGGFAIMSIAGNEHQNYPLNYFYFLSNINTKIKSEITNQNIKVDNNVDNNHDWVFNNNEEWSELRDAIYDKITDDVVESSAKRNKIDLPKKLGKYSFDKMKYSKTYLLVILASYGDGGTMKLDDFISHFLTADKFLEEKKEGIALTFGINKGYEVFRNKYETSNFKTDIKFKLDSKLDYYTIESIYQFVFNGKKDNSTFEYIDDWCPKLNESNEIEGIETYKVLDKTVRYESLFGKLFKSISPNEIYKKIVLETQKWGPPYIKKQGIEKEGIEYFKNLLESSFREYTKKFYEEMEKRIKALEEANKNKDDKIKNLQSEKELLKSDYNKDKKEKEKQIEDLENTIKDKDDKITKPQNEKDEKEKKTQSEKDKSLNKEERKSELSKHIVKKLKEIARNLEIKGTAKLKKDELVEKIIDAEFNTGQSPQLDLDL